MRAHRTWPAYAVLALLCTACAGPSAPTSQTASPTPTTAFADGSRGGDWIVFQGPAGLARVRADGSDVSPFFDSSGEKGNHPNWSATADAMVFVRDEDDGTTDVWVSDRDGHHPRRVVDCRTPCQYAEDPSWSPDGKQIAFWTQGPTDTTQVVRIVDASDGKVLRTVTAPELQGPIQPRWSPDGRSLVLAVGQWVGGGADVVQTGSAIGVVDLTAAKLQIRLLTAFTMKASYPAWSPSGDTIVFMAGNLDPFFTQQAGPSNLFTIRPDGTALTQITDQASGEPKIALPEWTTGAHPILVTVIKGESNWNLGTLDADGTHLEDLVDPSSGFPVSGAHSRAMLVGS